MPHEACGTTTRYTTRVAVIGTFFARRQLDFLIIIQKLYSNNIYTFTWTVNYSGYSTTHEHESEGKRETITGGRVAVGPAVGDGARGEPSLALLHEPLQRRLPRHGQVAVRRLAAPSRCA